MVGQVWNEIPLHYPGFDIDEFVIMPNHLHGIILVGATSRDRPGADGYLDPDTVGASPYGNPDSGPVGATAYGNPDSGLVGAAPCGNPDSGLVGAAPCGRPDGAVSRRAGTGACPYGALGLPDVVHRLKTLTTKRYVDGVKQANWPRFSRRLWQRNYYEHVIRDENSLSQIRQYIADNPRQWALDRENPVNIHRQEIP